MTHWSWGQRGREGHIRRSAIEYEGMRLGVRYKGKEKEVKLAYLLPGSESCLFFFQHATELL